jgi:hypothetical protein
MATGKTAQCEAVAFRILMYGIENATQRSNSSTARIGTVAAALRYLAKEVITGKGRSGDFTSAEAEATRGHLMGERGIGRDVIVKFLADVPGVNENTVKQHISILKASGDYAKIIAASHIRSTPPGSA